jgi:hypothetical protein
MHAFGQRSVRRGESRWECDGKAVDSYGRSGRGACEMAAAYVELYKVVLKLKLIKERDGRRLTATRTDEGYGAQRMRERE